LRPLAVADLEDEPSSGPQQLVRLRHQATNDIEPAPLREEGLVRLVLQDVARNEVSFLRWDVGWIAHDDVDRTP
jgi:hypothetical protein